MSSEQHDSQSELIEGAAEEQDFVRDRLNKELGREPTKDEIDEWIREHTESY